MLKDFPLNQTDVITLELPTLSPLVPIGERGAALFNQAHVGNAKMLPHIVEKSIFVFGQALKALALSTKISQKVCQRQSARLKSYSIFPMDHTHRDQLRPTWAC